LLSPLSVDLHADDLVSVEHLEGRLAELVVLADQDCRLHTDLVVSFVVSFAKV